MSTYNKYGKTLKNTLFKQNYYLCCVTKTGKSMLTKHSMSPTLLDYDGARFKGEICGKWMSGRISVEDDGVYLCQNVVDGSDCKEKHGYRYSWFCGSGLFSDLPKYFVGGFRILGY